MEATQYPAWASWIFEPISPAWLRISIAVFVAVWLAAAFLDRENGVMANPSTPTWEFAAAWVSFGISIPLLWSARGFYRVVIQGLAGGILENRASAKRAAVVAAERARRFEAMGITPR